MDVIVFNASTNQNGMGSSWRHITSFFSFLLLLVKVIQKRVHNYVHSLLDTHGNRRRVLINFLQ